MNDRRVAVFFYGLFMDAQELRARGVSPSDERLAYVTDFSLRIGKRATLLPLASSRVYGVLMQVPLAELNQLYSDPSVRDYKAEAVLAFAEGETPVAALCYNLLAAPDAKEFNADYAAKLRDLAERLQLPSGYVSSIGH